MCKKTQNKIINPLNFLFLIFDIIGFFMDICCLVVSANLTTTAPIGPGRDYIINFTVVEVAITGSW